LNSNELVTITEQVKRLEQKSELRKTVKLSPEQNDRLESLMLGLGIKTRTKAFELLMDEFARKNPEVFENKVATFENVLSDPAPVCLYGKPGSGKSTTMKQLVIEASKAGMGVIIIDVANEYGDLTDVRKVSATAAATRRFKHGKFRIVPDKDPRQRQFSIQRVFERLNQLAFKKKLENFFIGIDEGNELQGIKEMYDFLIESRKFVRKAVIISADPAPYSQICTLMRPRPKSPQ
jgi:hypothetical protein